MYYILKSLIHCKLYLKQVYRSVFISTWPNDLTSAYLDSCFDCPVPQLFIFNVNDSVSNVELVLFSPSVGFFNYWVVLFWNKFSLCPSHLTGWFSMLCSVHIQIGTYGGLFFLNHWKIHIGLVVSRAEYAIFFNDPHIFPYSPLNVYVTYLSCV